jgi:hypothetical protein
MKLSVLALALSCLSGCAAEHTVLNLASESAAKPRHKARVAKVPGSTRTSIHDKAPELALPQWNVPLPRPSRVLQYALPPPVLFKTASPAVYAVLGQATALATSQGSAVAVSSKEAITNCHVVARAKMITLANATTRLRAEVIAGDRKTDRCYLRALDGELEPVSGFRDYASFVGRRGRLHHWIAGGPDQHTRRRLVVGVTAIRRRHRIRPDHSTRVARLKWRRRV